MTAHGLTGILTDWWETLMVSWWIILCMDIWSRKKICVIVLKNNIVSMIWSDTLVGIQCWCWTDEMWHQTDVKKRCFSSLHVCFVQLCRVPVCSSLPGCGHLLFLHRAQSGTGRNQLLNTSFKVICAISKQVYSHKTRTCSGFSAESIFSNMFLKRNLFSRNQSNKSFSIMLHQRIQVEQMDMWFIQETEYLL